MVSSGFAHHYAECITYKVRIGPLLKRKGAYVVADPQVGGYFRRITAYFCTFLEYIHANIEHRTVTQIAYLSSRRPSDRTYFVFSLG